MVAIGYCRVSSDKQENSADAQERRIRAFAEAKEFTLLDVVVDLDEFSGNLKRPGAQKVLEMVREKTVQAVVITKLDRLTRSTKDALELAELFRDKGVSFITIDENIDTNSPMGELFYTLTAALAQCERRLISSRTRDGLQNLKKQGFPAGTPPYGFIAQPRTDEERRLKIRKPLLPNEREQEILAVIRCQRENGLSFKEIARHLNREGYRTRPSKKFPKGGEWVVQSVQRTFEEAKNAGN